MPSMPDTPSTKETIKQAISPKWAIQAAPYASATTNPIRNIVDRMKIEPNPNKRVIPLGLGDPTVNESFVLHEKGIAAIAKHAASAQCNGYVPMVGSKEACHAVAKYVSRWGPHAGTTGGSESSIIHSDNVILTSGCSGALEIVIGALAQHGDNLLMPKPGFSIYKTICMSKGIDSHFYNLKPESDWEVDLNHMRSQVDENTKAIIINNPSNPCGSVYSETHLRSILALAQELHLPVIADEIYAEMSFFGHKFTSCAQLTTDYEVPVFIVGGLAKRFMVPGWRLGWVVTFDKLGLAKEIQRAMVNLCGVIIGSNTIVQAALPEILFGIPDSYHSDNMRKLEKRASVVLSTLSGAPGLNPIVPQGGMYMMIELDIKVFSDISDDIDFSGKLFSEESVQCLPGSCFMCPNFIRLVYCLSELDILEACQRIKQFCQRHSRAKNT